jgi:hypothetical protein
MKERDGPMRMTLAPYDCGVGINRPRRWRRGERGKEFARPAKALNPDLNFLVAPGGLGGLMSFSALQSPQNFPRPMDLLKK